MPLVRVASPELIVIKLLQDRDVTGFHFGTSGFSTTLPKLTAGDNVGQVTNNWGDKTSWIVTSPLGGNIVTGTNLYNGTVAVDVFARPKVAGKNAPWGVASVVAQSIAEVSVDWTTNVQVAVVQGQTTFRPVSVSSFDVIGMPTRINNDPNGLAHFSMTVSVTYTVPPGVWAPSPI